MHHDPGTISFNPYHHQNPSDPVDKYRKTSMECEISYSNWRNHNQEFMEDDAESPRLWKNSPGPSPSRPLLFSENSRAEAIVRGQWELMEMVKNMPESSYELSLKDMVEHQRSIESPGPVGSSSGDGVDQRLHRRAVVKVKRSDDQNRRIERNLSLEHKGLFLNMVFPFSFKAKKKNNSVKVSGKSDEGLKGERDWWKKRFRGSSDSDSSKTSDSSKSSDSSGAGSSSSAGDGGAGRKRSSLFSGCWPFFHSKRNKSAK